jgi:hypothetical protein
MNLAHVFITDILCVARVGIFVLENKGLSFFAVYSAVNVENVTECSRYIIYILCLVIIVALKSYDRTNFSMMSD